MSRQSNKPKRGKPPSMRPGHRSFDESIGAADVNDRSFIAIHEAGHAVAAVVLGQRLNSVDIRRRRMPDGRLSMGFTDSPVSGKLRDLEALTPVMIQTMAGPMAEHHVNPGAADKGAYSGDSDTVHRLAAIAVCQSIEGEGGQRLITPEEIQRNKSRIDEIVLDVMHKADEFARRHWQAITAAATYLLKHESASKADIERIIAENPPAD